MARKSKSSRLNKAQNRFLRKLLADPAYLPRRASTRQTLRALERRQCLHVERDRNGDPKVLTPLWNPDTREWLDGP